MATKQAEKAPGFVEFGGEAHSALLGLGNENLRPRDRAAREKALTTKPAPTSRKVPVTEDNYLPSTRYDPGDEIIDGWVRRARP
jgi:hypothetical protein